MKLVDIKGDELEVGQVVVFCPTANNTELEWGVIENMTPQTIKIRRSTKNKKSWRDLQYGSSSKDKYYRSKPKYCTKRLVTQCSHYSNKKYNRMEVFIVETKEK